MGLGVGSGCFDLQGIPVRSSLRMDEVLERDKGIWWMPWHREAMKDVALCDKPGEGESNR